MVGDAVGAGARMSNGWGPRYEEVRRLGPSTTGRTWVAHDTRLQRTVAIEVMPDRVDAPANRMMHRARALASLNHPNVVAIYEIARTADGNHLVREYVDAPSLAVWQRSPRGWRELVEVYRGAGRGLVALAGAGLVRGRFEPADVLVTANGTAKVLARGMEEAADGNEAVAQRRSLCRALWAALYGESPDAAPAKRGRGSPRIRRVLLRGLEDDADREVPMAMEALVEALDPAPTRRGRWVALMSFAAVGTAMSVPGRVGSSELECEAGAAAIERSWGPTTRERAEKAIAALGDPQLTEVGPEALRSLDAYADRWRELYAEACRRGTGSDDAARETFELQATCLRRARAGLDAAGSVLATPERGLAPRWAGIAESLPSLSRCADVDALRGTKAEPSALERPAVEAARGLLARGRAELAAGRISWAEADLERAEELVTSSSFAPIREEAWLLQAEIHDQRGDYEASEGALRRALDSAMARRDVSQISLIAARLMYEVGYRRGRAREALASFRVLAETGAAALDPGGRGRVWHHLATVLSADGANEEAERLFRAALAAHAEVDPPRTLERGNVYAGLGVVLFQQSRFVEAEQAHRQALSAWQSASVPDDYRVGIGLDNLANAIAAQGRNQESVVLHVQALEHKERALGPDHPTVGQSQANLALRYVSLGDFEAAERNMRRALVNAEGNLDRAHPVLLRRATNFVAILAALGHGEEAVAQGRELVERSSASFGARDPRTASSRLVLAFALAESGSVDLAVEQCRTAWSSIVASLGPDHPDAVHAAELLGLTLVEAGHPADAVTLLQPVVGFGPAPLAATDTVRFDAGLPLLAALLETGAQDDARALAERLWPAAMNHAELAPDRRAWSAFLFARALESPDPDRHARAIALARYALELRSASDLGEDAEIAAEIRAWLVRHGGRTPHRASAFDGADPRVLFSGSLTPSSEVPGGGRRSRASEAGDEASGGELDLAVDHGVERVEQRGRPRVVGLEDP